MKTERRSTVRSGSIKAKCKVTYEYETRAPDTWAGAVAGSTSATIVARATRIASKKLKPRNWSSMNVVILERSGVKKESMSSGNEI